MFCFFKSMTIWFPNVFERSFSIQKRYSNQMGSLCTGLPLLVFTCFSPMVEAIKISILLDLQNPFLDLAGFWFKWGFDPLNWNCMHLKFYFSWCFPRVGAIGTYRHYFSHCTKASQMCWWSAFLKGLKLDHCVNWSLLK